MFPSVVGVFRVGSAVPWLNAVKAVSVCAGRTVSALPDHQVRVARAVHFDERAVFFVP